MTRSKKRHNDEAVAKQAAQWVARLYSGNASQADEEALSAWLKQDVSHSREYFRMLDVWDEVGADAVLEVAGAGETSLSARRTPQRAPWFRPAIAAAALLFVAVTSLVVLRPAGNVSDTVPVSAYATAVGETREVKLADGSVVTLNTGTKLFTDFNGNIRRAILDSGEAFFDVAKDPERPFVVTAGSQSVTVLGTRFNVQRKGAKLTVAVVEGKVAVHDNIAPEKLEETARTLFSAPDDVALAAVEPFFLEAGSVGTFEKSVELKGRVEVADAEGHQAWRQGVLRFRDESLQAVVDELSRYTEMPISITDKSLAELQISGVFHHTDLEGALAGLEAMLPVTIAHENGRIRIESLPQ